MPIFSTATFGAGCFWGVEETFRKIPGVKQTTVGYMGGTIENPSYEQVCTDETGHAEVVQLQFDPAEVSYEQLLAVFWKSHNPTEETSEKWMDFRRTEKPATETHSKRALRWWQRLRSVKRRHFAEVSERNRQGPDIGTQYRSVIFYHTSEQEKIARASKQTLEDSHRFSKPIATEIIPAQTFYRAEEYHQQYLAKRGKTICG